MPVASYIGISRKRPDLGVSQRGKNGLFPGLDSYLRTYEVTLTSPTVAAIRGAIGMPD